MKISGCAAIAVAILVCRGAYATLLAGAAISADTGAAPKFSISEKSFHCMTDMTHVRHFYVDNLAGDLKGTVEVANSTTGVGMPRSRAWCWSRPPLKE